MLETAQPSEGLPVETLECGRVDAREFGQRCSSFRRSDTRFYLAYPYGRPLAVLLRRERDTPNNYSTADKLLDAYLLA